MSSIIIFATTTITTTTTKITSCFVVAGNKTFLRSSFFVSIEKTTLKIFPMYAGYETSSIWDSSSEQKGHYTTTSTSFVIQHPSLMPNLILHRVSHLPHHHLITDITPSYASSQMLRTGVRNEILVFLWCPTRVCVH
jgi:hypothetical protein